MSPDRIQFNNLALGVGPIVDEARKSGKIRHSSAEWCLEHEQLIGAANLDPDVPTFPLKTHGVFDKIHATHATGLSDSGPSKFTSRSLRATVNGTGLNHSRSSVHPCAGEEWVEGAPNRPLHPSNDSWHPLGCA